LFAIASTPPHQNAQTAATTAYTMIGVRLRSSSRANTTHNSATAMATASETVPERDTDITSESIMIAVQKPISCSWLTSGVPSHTIALRRPGRRRRAASLARAMPRPTDSATAMAIHPAK
jgi:hypothetical protein